MSNEQWWEQVAARRAAEPEMSGIRADSNDVVDAWEEREAELEPNMQGRAPQKNPGGPGMMPPMMGGMPGGAPVGAAAAARPLGPTPAGPVGAEGGAMMQAAGMTAAARTGGPAGAGGVAGLGAGSAGAGGAGGLGLGAGGAGGPGLGAGGAGLGTGGAGLGGVAAAGAPGGAGLADATAEGAAPGEVTGADLDGDGVPDAEAANGLTGGPGSADGGTQTSPATMPLQPPQGGGGPGSFTVDPDQLRAIASRWDAMSNQANQLSAESATSRSDFALLADADASHHELTGKATNWSAGAGSEFKDLNDKLTSAASEYKAAEDSGVVQAGKVN